MARNPTIPRSKTNPVGQTRRIARVRSAVFSDIAKAQKLAIETLEEWPVEVRNAFTANAFYEFMVDTSQIERLIAAITQTLKEGGGPEEARRAAQAAYREGVAKTMTNLSGLTDLITQSVTERLSDQQTLRKSTLAGSRAFEQMQGFADQTATDLGRVMFEAVQSGENPRQTAKRIRERFGVSKARAERIARTETTMALRRGRWDEAREQEQKVGMEVRLLHNSALIPGRTRDSHARRHGKIVTIEEEAAWYAQDANAINCLCSQTEIFVGPDGQPLFGQKLVERMEKERARFLGLPVAPEEAPASEKPYGQEEDISRTEAAEQRVSEEILGSFSASMSSYDSPSKNFNAVSYRSSLSEDDVEALTEYGAGLFNSKVGAYSNINGYLRNGKPKFAKGVDEGELERISSNLLRSFDRAATTKEVNLYRGVRFERGQDLYSQLQPGDLLSDSAPISTTTSRKVAKKFQQKLSRDDVVYDMEIQAPVGSPAIPIADANGFNQEAEVLLAPGNLRLVSRRGNKMILRYEPSQNEAGRR